MRGWPPQPVHQPFWDRLIALTVQPLIGTIYATHRRAERRCSVRATVKYPTRRSELLTSALYPDRGYPEEFVRAVTAEFPDWEDIHLALSESDFMVGALLSRFADGHLGSPEQIVADFEQGRMQDVRARAERVIRCRRLFEQWLAITDSWRGQPCVERKVMPVLA